MLHLPLLGFSTLNIVHQHQTATQPKKSKEASSLRTKEHTRKKSVTKNIDFFVGEYFL
jgi:hypothetical protein